MVMLVVVLIRDGALLLGPDFSLQFQGVDTSQTFPESRQVVSPIDSPVLSVLSGVDEMIGAILFKLEVWGRVAAVKILSWAVLESCRMLFTRSISRVEVVSCPMTNEIRL